MVSLREATSLVQCATNEPALRLAPSGHGRNGESSRSYGIPSPHTGGRTRRKPLLLGSLLGSFLSLSARAGEAPRAPVGAMCLVYVLNAGGTGNISGFTVDEGGRLSPLPGSTRPLGRATSGAAQVSFDRSGDELAVTESGRHPRRVRSAGLGPALRGGGDRDTLRGVVLRCSPPVGPLQPAGERLKPGSDGAIPRSAGLTDEWDATPPLAPRARRASPPATRARPRTRLRLPSASLLARR